MLRKRLFAGVAGEKFRQRGHEIFRIEALSDAVFAFSVSFLVASLEVPQTFSELRLIINGALPFFATVSIIFLLWYQQYSFFRHYGLNSKRIIFLNLVYLAVILFYVYPLKFLFSLLLSLWTGLDLFPEATKTGAIVLLPHDFPILIILFSTGYCVIWLLLYLMHRQPRRHLVTPELNKYEKAYTRRETRGALCNFFIGMLSIIMVLSGSELLAGLCYLPIPLVLLINHLLFRKEINTGI